MTPSIRQSQHNKPSAPLWAQILVWVFLLGLLGIMAIGLMRTQVPMIEINSVVPDLTLEFYDGYEYNGAKQIRMSDLRGKVVVINFWASWCVPCEEEAELLETAWQLYQSEGEVVFIGIDFVDTPANGLGYLRKFNITYPNAPDLQESISPFFNRNMGVPETYFIDRQGILRAIKIGPFLSINELQAILAPLIAES